MFNKTISSDFFTTISLKQALYSLYLLSVGSYKLRYGKDTLLFEDELLGHLDCKVGAKVLSFYNARSALFHTLTGIGLGKDDEVIVNAYTCVSVSNSIIQSGATVKYCDIETDTLSCDIDVLRNTITDNTKVLLLQHTFGMNSRDYLGIIQFAKEKNIIVIEDCALSLGNGHNILGDFALFSTGRDKVISSITGGFLLINNSIYIEDEYFSSFKKILHDPTILLVCQNLMYNIVGYVAYKLYDFFKLGRILIFLSRRLQLITEILTPSEKECEYSKFYLKFPNALAFLARKELKNLENYTKIRKKNTEYLFKHIDNDHIEKTKILDYKTNFFRYYIILESSECAENLYKYMRKENILLGKTWNGVNIVPVGTDLKKAGYTLGSSVVSENMSNRILFVPNHMLVTDKDLVVIVDLMNAFKN